MQGLLLAGRYRLVDVIGSGGMGRVWRAHDEVLHRTVAIKELTAALYVSESDQPRLLARTRAEARAAARINHSAVVTVHDVLEHDGRPWIVMELVEGNSLADEVKEKGRIEPVEAARIGLWVLRALRAAHAAGVLHRDIKPGNVLLSQDGRVLLTDFGIAQIEGDTTITRTGEVVGSVDYLAPERVRGHDPGPSSDLWALGATLYTAVEGRSPFRRTSPLTTMQAVVDEEPPAPGNAGALAPVITALLRKDAAERPDASQTERLLAEAAEGRRPHSAQEWVPTQYAGPDSGSAQTGTAGLGAPQTGTTGLGASRTGAANPGYQPQGAGSTPYPSVTAAAAYQESLQQGPRPTSHATAHLPFQQTPATSGATLAPVSPVPPKRHGGRTLALVVVLAALVGGGAVVALQKWDQGRQGNTAAPVVSHSPSASPKAGADSEGLVPDSWVRIDDPAGFGLSLPKDWKRTVFGTDGALTQIDYSPDDGEHFLRVAVDTDPDDNNPHQHQLDLEEQLQRLVDYQRVTLAANTYRDRPGSQWDYTWTALAKDTAFPGPRRAIDETYLSRDGVEYAIYVSVPVADWATAYKEYKAILQSWRPKHA